jgi:hypothetical protein
MKNIIALFLRQNEVVSDFLNDSSHNFKDVDTTLKSYAEFLKQSHFNVALAGQFIRLLQLSNDSSVFETYTLADIKTLLKSTLALEQYNLDMYVDAAHFEWAVMDDGVAARSIIEDGLNRAAAKISELNKLLREIDAV